MVYKSLPTRQRFAQGIASAAVPTRSPTSVQPQTGYNAGTIPPDAHFDPYTGKPVGPPPAGFPQQTPIPINTDGHFHPVVRINGVQLTMLADTRRSSVALTAKDAQKIGINLQTLQFTGKANTANGTVPRASLLLQDVNTGGIILRNVRASCCVSGSESLLGMSVLGQLNIRIANGLMYLAPK